MIEHERAHIFANANKNIDATHPSLPEGALVANMRFRGILSPETAQLLTPAMKSVFQEHTPTLPKKLTQYQAFITKAPEKEMISGKKDTAVIFLSGLGGNALGNAHIVSGLYKEMPDAAFSAGLSASVGADTVKDPYVHSIERRAVEQAVVIFELLKRNEAELRLKKTEEAQDSYEAENKIKHLRLVGHSLGAQEAVFVTPLLQKMLTESKMDIDISSLILINPGGQYEQGIGKFAFKGVPSVAGFHEEGQELVPSVDQQNLLKVRLQLAKNRLQLEKNSSNEAAVAQLQYVLDRGEKIFKSLPNDVQMKLEDINEAIKSKNPLIRMRAISQRRKVMRPLVRKLLDGADMRKPLGVVDTAKMMFRTAEVSMTRRNDRVTSQAPEWIRDQLTTPIAIISGERDAYFGDVVEKIDHGENPYPNAQSVMLGKVTEGSHIGIAVHADDYAATVRTFVDRLPQEKGINIYHV